MYLELASFASGTRGAHVLSAFLCVTCGGVGGRGGQATGLGAGGHSSSLHPRAEEGEWEIQIDRKSNTKAKATLART